MPQWFTTLLAVWGAVLSSVLGLIKITEFWGSRFRIDARGNFTTHPDIGNEVVILNLNDYPILLSYWELLWVSRRWPFRSFAPLESPDEFHTESRIDAHATLTLTFKDQFGFDSGAKARRGRRIFIRLHVAGRRPRLRKLLGRGG